MRSLQGYDKNFYLIFESTKYLKCLKPKEKSFLTKKMSVCVSACLDFGNHDILKSRFCGQNVCIFNTKTC